MNGVIFILKFITDFYNPIIAYMYSHDSNVDSELVSMWHCTTWLIKINNLNLRTPIFAVLCNKFTCIRTVTLLNTRRNYLLEDLFPSGRDLIGMVSKRRLIFVFLSYFTNRAYFRKCIWVTFKHLPIFFGVGGLFGRRTSRCEITGLNWSNLDRISSISVIC